MLDEQHGAEVRILITADHVDLTFNGLSFAKIFNGFIFNACLQVFLMTMYALLSRRTVYMLGGLFFKCRILIRFSFSD